MAEEFAAMVSARQRLVAYFEAKVPLVILLCDWTTFFIAEMHLAGLFLLANALAFEFLL
jgi:hypothetical protein